MKLEIILALLVPICLGTTQLNCGGKPDLVFVLDGSTSVSQSDFARQLNFVKDIINTLEIGTEATQIAVVTFSDAAQVDVSLNATQNKQSIRNRIDGIQQRLGNTNTSAALDLVRTQVLIEANGARDVGPKVVIVITDGHSQNRLHTAAAANRLRSNGVILAAIGVGNDVRQAELQSIANDANHLFNVGSFQALSTIQDDLVPSVCPTRPPDCSGNPDLVFVLDRSTSVNEAEFGQLRDFVLSFVHPITVGPNDTQIAIVTFASNAKVEFYLNDHSTTASVEAAIGNLRHGLGNTYTELALRKVRNDVLTIRKGARRHGAKVVIVVTDGEAQRETQTRTAATNLKNDNVQLFVVGVGEFDREDLEVISDRIFTTSGYDTISSIRDVLLSQACSVTRSWNPSSNALRS